MQRNIRWYVASAVMLAAANVVSAQSVQPLARGAVEFSEPFSSITDLRELRDGRLIISDSRENTLQLVDLARRSARSIGRQGAGPAEWSMPSQFYALPGDTTWMSDHSNGRYFVILPDGTPGRTLPFDTFPNSVVDALSAVDASGRMLLLNERRNTNVQDGSSGVVDVMRFDRRSQRLDTVARLAWPKGEMSMARTLPNGMLQMSTNLPFASRDAALIAPDGRIAIVRASPYRVEWLGLNGVLTTGPTAVSPRIRITEAERRSFIRSQIRPGRIISSAPTGAPPPGAPTARPRTPSLSTSEIDAMMNPDMTWPAEKPPFLRQGGVHMAPDGRVWVQRTRAHNDSIPVYDIFDAAGRVVERRSLPKRTRLVAIGAKSVYLARTDDDDLLWLQRVPYPQ